MAAKILRTMPDNNSNVPKHIGCMDGIFHHFGGGHFLSRRRVSSKSKSLPAGNKTSSIFYRDVGGISVRASAKQESVILTYLDSPRPSLPASKSKLYGFRESILAGYRFLHRKKSPRFSYEGREAKPSLEIKELPRYSLDSKRPISPLSEEQGSHRRQPSIVAKLMGLEDLEDMEVLEHDPISRPEEKMPTASSRRLELAPWWKRPEGTRVYGQIEKRLAQLEFQKSGKDLRALQQILQAMQNCEPKKHIRPCIESSRIPRQQKMKSLKQSDSAKRINQSMQAKSKSNLKVLNGGLGSDNSSSFDLTEQSNSISVQSDSMNSEEEMEVSSAYRRERKKRVRITEDDFIRKSYTPEQPSPVSVLDAITFNDEPPSPVRIIKNAFEEVDSLRYNKTMEITKPEILSTHRFEDDSTSEVTCLRPTKPNQHDKESKSTNRGYISEILPASGALNGARSKYMDEIQKKLVSDVINELSIEKIASNRSISSVKQPKQLLKKLCFEIEELPCKLDEEDDDCFRKMLEKDLGGGSSDWKLGICDNSGIVLDIERTIFRDMIYEMTVRSRREFQK